MSQHGVKMLGTGACVPERILTNADLEKIVQTSDEWITTRTGIKERHIADPQVATSDLAFQAARIALDEAGISPQQLDCIIVATATPDMPFPSTACIVQQALGAIGSTAFDITAACSGFVYGLSIVKGMIESGTYKYVLLIGAETLSRVTDWTDRNTCVLFGDGAGAMVLGRTDKPTDLLAVFTGADGSYAQLLELRGGGSRNPCSLESIEKKLHFIRMDGREVFKVAVIKMAEALNKTLEIANKNVCDITLFIPHQANLRIIEAIAKRIDVPLEKVFINLHKYGNMSAATCIIGLDEARRQGRVKQGDLVELVAFGGGFTWGAAIIRV